MDNHQWWLSQAYTCAFHISMHIHITFMTYHLYMLIACQSRSIHFLCLWHIFYLYFSCFYTLHIPYSFYNLLFYVFGISFIYTFLVSILCIFHIHSITYYSMSLIYLISILLLYSCLSHILCLFLVICLYLILDLFHIISCIIFFASFLYFHVHFLFMFVYCAYIIYFHISYTFILPILYYSVLLSTFLYFSYTVLLYAFL